MAIGYVRGQGESLRRFVEDERLPLDNNRSERALRTAAVGRKNFLFVGHDEAGRYPFTRMGGMRRCSG